MVATFWNQYREKKVRKVKICTLVLVLPSDRMNVYFLVYSSSNDLFELELRLLSAKTPKMFQFQINRHTSGMTSKVNKSV